MFLGMGGCLTSSLVVSRSLAKSNDLFPVTNLGSSLNGLKMDLTEGPRSALEVRPIDRRSAQQI